MDSLEIRLLELCCGHCFASGGQNRTPDKIRIKANIGPASGTFAEQGTAGIAQARSALRATAIKAEIQGFSHR
jgi:hypothetical protein